ncbi:MAG: DUF116 domain-containing protein [Nanoarchaeota archaeon]
MNKVIKRLINIGANISTKKALKVALKTIGAEEENIDKIYIEVNNAVNKDKFLKIKNKDKAVFLPQCLKNSKKCKGILTEDGHKCVHCGACKISEITKRAENMGYKVFIVPGGSMIEKLIKKHKPKAVFGVACLKELTMAVENIPLPTQTVKLKKDGCLDTDADINEIFDVLEGNGKD